MNINTLIEYISSTPLTWLILTLGSFKLGIIIYERFNKHTLLQPIIISYVTIISTLLLTGVSYTEYFKSVEIIHFFLGPATVALALPLYKNLKHIKSIFVPICITLVVSAIFSILVAVGILWILDANIITILSMTTKSITAPIAIVTSEQIGAIPSLAVSFVVITGILGALFGTSIFKFMGIKDDRAKGFALGVVSHGIGTARAVEISQKSAAFGALAMGLCGLFTAVFLPLVLVWIS
ncbi:MAG: LrgA-associated membrane protein LrgB [uncultured Campylobacterales bacterium]|uniref:LrgA-associated membrane protein LrgB n=1 Tax=uncultured Campylobacterales bacterium TaxID=352960 RepID=A0A6S6TI84_9BACT|nr:MAG: LrgA-associated membrane protein LrgB [uncultured Campylobacterales bacterium]